MHACMHALDMLSCLYNMIVTATVCYIRGGFGKTGQSLCSCIYGYIVAHACMSLHADLCAFHLIYRYLHIYIVDVQLYAG